MNNVIVKIGDIVEMKKEHPCAKRSKQFEVVRVGADIKLKCLGCGNVIMLDRETFNKKVKSVISSSDK